MCEKQEPRRYASAAELARRWGVSGMALTQRRRRGTMLPPDVFIGDQPGWDVRRADAWWESVQHVAGRPGKV